MKVTLEHYLVVGAILFSLGLYTAITRRNAIGILLGVELVLNAAALNFIAFDHYVAESHGPAGQVFALFIVALAASGAVVALAICLEVVRSHRGLAVDDLARLSR
jgi:NADH-quinone oxidoreductase subunit K